ncbi:DUF4157 domain-containing protein [Streptomyces sp. NPDC048416]|uniref:eCIS core domain-containing protein n=1 Tax=Streptomyces sp. NPDC048416 TaxID=3365546 RepID=UPI003710BABE
MHANDPAQNFDGKKPACSAAKAPIPGGGLAAQLLAFQGSAGNAAVVQMLRAAGHPWAQERHQHGAGCGHQQTERAAEQPAVQRSAVHDVLSTGGRPLDDATRTDMEGRLGADFSDVRIHNDSAAKASAAEVGARAYTSGNHVVIGDGGSDKHTLAHELTHVIQQRQGPVAGNDNGSGLKVSDPSDRFEREAEANATRVMSGPGGETVQRARAEGPAHHAGTVQRAPNKKKDNGEGSSGGGGGGKRQGDHVFNSLDAKASGIVRKLNTAWADFVGALDDDTKDAIKASPAMKERMKDLNDGRKNAVDAVATAATAAGSYGHPGKGSAFVSFCATLPEHSTSGSDANSTTYGTFSTALEDLAAACADEAWTLPQEMATAAGATSWPDYLAARIYDADAALKVRAKRLSNNSDRTAFDAWQTETKTRYMALFAAIIAAMRATRAAVTWLRQQNQAAQGGPQQDAA